MRPHDMGARTMGKNIGKVTFRQDSNRFCCGSDINVYGMARAFHEEYGLVSEAYAYFQLSPLRNSARSSMCILSTISTIS